MSTRFVNTGFLSAETGERKEYGYGRAGVGHSRRYRSGPREPARSQATTVGNVAPQQHLDWFKENIAWFERLSDEQLGAVVPNCPGWTVDSVVEHLSIGLGFGYPVAMAAASNTPDSDVFATADWPTGTLTGRAALRRFSEIFAACISTFESTDPTSPCWTYAGPGVAAFWFRRAAIETALHRIDIEEALAVDHENLAPDRAFDAIVETLEFALPFAATMVDAPTGPLVVESTDIGLHMLAGEYSPSVDRTRAGQITGDGHAVLCTLWGREPSPRRNVNVTTSGDDDVLAQWLTLIERAFADR